MNTGTGTPTPDPFPTTVGGSEKTGITMTMTVDQWRDVRDALIDYPHTRNRTDIKHLSDGISTIIRDCTRNPMD